jgi:hypothetical protein
MNTGNAVTRNDDRGSKGNEVGHELWSSLRLILALCALFSLPVLAQDQPNSKDPTGMKRYEGSVLIGYRAPRFDEYLIPLGPPTGTSPLAFEKSESVEGQASLYTYLAPAGRSPAELFRNYKLEFQRLGVEIQYEKAGEGGWFGSLSDKLECHAETCSGVALF